MTAATTARGSPAFERVREQEAHGPKETAEHRDGQSWTRTVSSPSRSQAGSNGRDGRVLNELAYSDWTQMTRTVDMYSAYGEGQPSSTRRMGRLASSDSRPRLCTSASSASGRSWDAPSMIGTSLTNGCGRLGHGGRQHGAGAEPAIWTQPWIAPDRVSPYTRSSSVERTILDLHHHHRRDQ
jgi:hypothetical protein